MGRPEWQSLEREDAAAAPESSTGCAGPGHQRRGTADLKPGRREAWLARVGASGRHGVSTQSAACRFTSGVNHSLRMRRLDGSELQASSESHDPSTQLGGWAMRRRKLSPSFALSVYPMLGPARKIETLRDVAVLILALDQPRQRKAIWKRTAALAKRASSSRRKADIAAARSQVVRALFSEQWL
jgi:hypothetical protein